MCYPENRIFPGEIFDKHGENDVSEQICEDRDDHWCGDSDEETATGYISNACISSVLVCNSFQDCRDNSDENECVG